jgi:hypothetical protein
MSQPSITRNFRYGNAPQKITLLGDKTKKPEPATHIIEFPGGAVELSRTTDGNYWAHIIINRDFALPDDSTGLHEAYGEIVSSRIDYDFPAEPNIVALPNAEQVRQVAILIRPRRTDGTPAPASLPRVPLPLLDGVAT